MANNLNVAVIVSAVDKLSGPIQGMSDKLQGLRVTGLKMAAAGAAITGALVGAAHSSARVGDELAKASIKTGVTTESLSKLRYAAEQSGVEFGQLEFAMFRQARAAEAAARGGNEQAKAYEALGVSVKDSNGNIKDGETLMRETAEALSKMENPTLKTAYAMAIFGRSGAQMLPMFKDGAAGIDELTKRAEELGLVWSKTAAEDAERYNDALNDVKLALGGVGKTIGSSLFPIIAGLAERTGELIGRYTAFADAHPTLNKAVVMLSVGLGMLLSVVGSVLVALPFFVNGWTAAKTVLSATNVQAMATQVGVLRAGAAARLSGLWAAISSVGWHTQIKVMWGATGSTKAFLASGIQAIPAVLGKLTLAMKAFAIGSYKFLLSPIGIITVAIAALVVELYYLHKAYKEMQDAMKQAEEKKAEAKAAEAGAQSKGYVTVESAAKSLGYSDKDIERGRYDKQKVEAERQRQIAARRARMGAGAQGGGAQAGAVTPGTPASAARSPEDALKQAQDMMDKLSKGLDLGGAGGGGGGGGWAPPAAPLVPVQRQQVQQQQQAIAIASAPPVALPPQQHIVEFRLSSDGETVRILAANPAFGESVRQVVREVGWKMGGYAPAM